MCSLPTYELFETTSNSSRLHLHGEAPNLELVLGDILQEETGFGVRRREVLLRIIFGGFYLA